MAQVTLGDVAIESRETYKGDKSGMPIVGLEHLIPEDVVLSLWDRDKENTFTKMFRKGDMLFGRRRAYLKKAAQAPFDGICSGDITVIRAKEDRLIPELLPFIIQNDVLFDFAVGKSAGSLSPRVKWENLKNYKFELPPLPEQKKLAEALWAINDTLQAYQKLLIETDELVKSQFEILSSYQDEKKGNAAEESAYDIAIDIGTTTIAMELLGADSKQVIHTATTINGQRVYGADVISRIQASTEGKKAELQESIRRDLQKGIHRLVEETGIARDKIRNIVIGGNTTMGHLLMGYDCDTLGVYPFTPVNIDFIEGTDQEIIGEGTGKTKVTLLPGISTYVGGDIVSGLYACGFEKASEVCLLVYLGTNGEMALGNKDRILVTSTAAGPAFEGGNITWGTGSIPGAICSVKLNGTDVEVKTIRDQVPEGICGTGVVEITAELVREEIVSDSGMLDEEYFEQGFPLAKNSEGKEIVFIQKDVREIQLAKAAVRAGVETLLLRYGIEKEEVSKVYLAGGFGYKLDTSKAIAIGMLPEEFKDRIEAVGNSSLAGAVKYLSDPDREKEIRRLVDISEEIGLSSDKDFNEFYMDAMFFEEE